MRRVAITGLGLVTPAGNDVATTWATLLAGRSQGAPITIFDASGFSTRIAAEVKGFDPRAVIDDRRLLKFANRSHAFALAAADQAFADAGLKPTAGYFGDSRRFKKEIDAVQKELGIEDRVLWRCR